jgi:hypothetical protein
MRYCGIHVSARPDAQLLATLHRRRGTDGGTELVASFYAPGDPEAVARTVLGFGRACAVAVDAPAGRRLDLLAPGRPLHARLDLPTGRFERHRVAEALLLRRGIPLYPVVQGPEAGASWHARLAAGFAVHAGVAAHEPYRPEAEPGVVEAPVGLGALRFGRVAEAYPDAVLTTLLGHRPAPRRTPWGLQQRIAALRLRGVVDADGGLWHRTLEELDAVTVAYAAYALAENLGSWAGDRREGVVVVPVRELAERYEPLPPPGRLPLAR